MALSQAAMIVIDLGLGGGAGGARLVIIGVAHPRGGELGEALPYTARSRGHVAGQRGHRASRPCLKPRTPRLRRAQRVIGFGSVLIQQKRGVVRRCSLSSCQIPDREPHQIGFELLAGGLIDEPGRSSTASRSTLT